LAGKVTTEVEVSPMRKLFSLVMLAAVATSCGKDATSPTTTPASSVQSSGTSGLNGSNAGPGHMGFGVPGLFRLPDNLKLTADQQAAIKAALKAFRASPGDPAALKAKIDAILTPAQKAWLAANAPKPCPAAPALTDAQKAQIKALRDAFQQANKADLDAIRAVMQQAHAARQAGKTRADIKAILDAAKPAFDRLRTARQKLQSDVSAVLTPEQRAARCHAGASGAGRRGGFRGPMSPQGRFGPGAGRGGFGYRGPISS
jgi:Spy/CpxP family protein refolding chaperone